MVKAQQARTHHVSRRPVLQSSRKDLARRRPSFLVLRHASRGRTPFLNPRGWCRLCWVAIDIISKLSLLPNEDSSVDWSISLWEYASSAIIFVADLDNKAAFTTQLCRPQAGFIFHDIMVVRPRIRFVSATTGDPWTVLQ